MMQECDLVNSSHLEGLASKKMQVNEFTLT